MDTFRIHYTNIRGLMTNHKAVEGHLLLHKPAVLALGETQISSLGDPYAYQIKGYTLIDRLFQNRGIVLYIRNDISFSVLQHLGNCSDPKFNYVWIEFRIDQHALFFCFLYRSPALSTDDTQNAFDTLSDSIEKILETSPNAEIVVAGDFNVHNDTWLPHSKPRDRDGETAELFAELNLLTQLVDKPTRIPDITTHKPHLLDLFLTSHPDKYTISVDSPLGSSDHCLVRAEFCINSPTLDSPPQRTLWHYKNANWLGLNEFFLKLNWVCLFTSGNIDVIALLISTIILSAMKEFIPSSIQKPKPDKNSWFNEACRIAIDHKNRAHKQYQSNPSSINHKLFLITRKNAKRIINNAKRNDNLKTRNKIRQILNGSNNPKSFWSFAGIIQRNFMGKKTSSIPPLKSNNLIYSSSKQKANILASQFAAASQLPQSNQLPPIIHNVDYSMNQVFFRTRVVSKILKDLNVNKSAGPDGIPPLVLKNCHYSLAKPLAKLFHLSMKTGVFPAIWKTANVHPVPKKGNKSDPSNYRPIAIVSILSKVMESVVNFHLMNYLEKFNLISDRQYGFRRGRSSGDLMIYLTDLWNRNILKRGETQIVALDISKAFDRVWHDSLFVKLNAIGLDSFLVSWIKSFLCNRKIQVVVDGVTSDPHILNAGVPQGSVLSPTLFLIFINDLLTSTLNPIHSYADDSTVSSGYSFSNHAPHNSTVVAVKQDEMMSSLSQDIKTILQWGKANRVEFNASKFQACLFTQKRDRPASSPCIDGTSLDNSQSVHMLGLDLDSKLIWSEHIYSTAKNAAKCLGYLRRSKFYFSPPELLTIYKAYIRPHMEYNSHVWGGAAETHLAALDRIQRRACRLIGDVTITSSLNSLEHRRNVGALCVFYKYYHGKCSSEIKELMPQRRQFSRNTRLAINSHEHYLEQHFSRTEQYSSSFIPRITTLWNSLHPTVFPESYNLQKFKLNIKDVTFRTQF